MVNGVGSIAHLNDTSISVSGIEAVGLNAGGGGVIIGNNLTIHSVANDEGHAVLAGAGGTITLTGGQIGASGESVVGLYAYDGGHITATDVVITMTGYGGDGVMAGTSPGVVTLTGGSILTLGEDAVGLKSYDGSHISATNVQIEMRGEFSAGALAYGAGSVTTMDGGAVTTLGESGHGLWAHTGGLTVANNVLVTTFGDRAEGASAKINGATLLLTGGTITTSGSSANGVSAFDTGILNATSATVTTSGTGASGALSSAATVTLQSVSLTTTGALGHGLSARAGGLLTATNTTASVTGLDAAAVHIATGSTATPNLLTVTGGSLASSQGPLILSEGGVGTISLNGPIAITSGIVAGQPALATVTAGAGGVTPSNLTLNLTGLGEVLGTFRVTGASNISNTTFNATNWTGDLIAEPANTPNTTLLSSRWTGQATNAANINIDGPSAWNVTGSSNATGTLSNAGLVQFVPLSSGFSTLTTGSYVGQGGRMAFNTYLGADSSPTNLLVLNGGTASGTTALSVANAGGAGELTVGDGIRLVQAVNGGATEAGAFSLSGRAAAGAYEYLLFRGGSSGAEDWFLRSTLIPVDPPAPGPVPPEPEPVIPLYRPEVPLYAPIPAMARHMGLATLGTLHERVGEEMNIQNRTGSGKFGNGTWARLIGEVGNSRWSGTVDARAGGTTLGGIQAGFDIYRNEHDNGHRDHVGVYIASMDYRSSAISGFALGQHNLQVGRLALNGLAAGAYWTHFGPSGWYLDAVIQQNWFDATATSLYDAQMSTSGTGFTASLEGAIRSA